MPNRAPRVGNDSDWRWGPAESMRCAAWPAVGDQTVSVERFTIGDAAELAGDVGPDPRLIGVLAETAGRVDTERLRARFAAALVDLPVLRRRFVQRGRNTLAARWETMDCPVEEHVLELDLHEPDGHAAEDGVAALRACERLYAEGLPEDRPMWRVTVLHGTRRDHLLFLAHHVLLDGTVAQPVLGRLLTDPVAPGELPPLPTPAETPGSTAAAPPRRLPLPRLPLGLLAGITHRASASSLLSPISQGFHLVTLGLPLAEVHDVGHRAGATVNDVLLAMVGMAIRQLAASRGEHLRRVVMSVPVTRPAPLDSQGTRNAVGAFAIAVPELQPGEASAQYLARLAKLTRRRKALVHGFWATPVFSLGLAALGGLGLYRPLFERQHAITTLVTNLRGPAGPLSVDGLRITSLTPISPALGNVCLVFAALSYAGQLRISVRLDHSVWPDEALLMQALEDAWSWLGTNNSL